MPGGSRLIRSDLGGALGQGGSSKGLWRYACFEFRCPLVCRGFGDWSGSTFLDNGSLLTHLLIWRENSDNRTPKL